MADIHEIVCVETEHPHRHIVSVGLSTGERLSVDAVRQAIQGGDWFVTTDGQGDRAVVQPDNCRIGECLVLTLRSESDQVATDNLDRLPSCD